MNYFQIERGVEEIKTKDGKTFSVSPYDICFGYVKDGEGVYITRINNTDIQPTKTPINWWVFVQDGGVEIYKYIGPPVQVIAHESFEQVVGDRSFSFKAFLLNSNCKLIAEVNNDLGTIQKVAILDGAFHDVEPIKVAVEYLQNELCEEATCVS